VDAKGKQKGDKGDSSDDEHLFEHMLGDWGSGREKEQGSNFKPGDAHEEVEGIGSMSAAGAYPSLLGTAGGFGGGL